MAASFLDTLSSLIVSREEIIEAEEFSKSYLSSLFPDLDLREGVALSDLVIRPNAVMIALIKKGLTVYFSNNSVEGITDDTPESDVDRIMSNFFVYRRVGTSSVIRARLYFLDGDRDIYLTTSNTFSVDNVVVFKPIVDTFISKTQLTYDGTVDEWYYDVDLISTTEDVSANLSSGDLIYHTTVDPYFVRATILYLVTKAVPTETNLELKARAETSISTRNLINSPSIISAIKGEFNYFNKVVSVGMGDVEMFRDLISVTNPFDTNTQDEIHIGGKVDVYVDTTLDTLVKQYTTDANGVVYIDGTDSMVEYVVFNLRRATTQEQSDNGLTDEVGQSEAFTVTYGGIGEDGNWHALSNFMDVGLSTRQVVKIAFTGGVTNANKKASFYLQRVNGLLGLQNYLDDRATRIVCADYLARSLEFYHLTVNVKKVGGVLLSEDEIASCTTTVQTYLTSLQAGEPFVLSNLVHRLVSETGITNLDVNLGVTYTLYDNRLSGATGTITSSLDPTRIQHFLLKSVTSV